MPIPYDIPLEPTKKPHIKDFPYTDEQLMELVQCAADPLYCLENYMRVQHSTKGAIPFKPYPYQKDMIRAFYENRFCIALTARQMGKALALDTPIPTPTGWTTMGAIQPGDEVLGDDGQPVLVSFATDPMVDHECFDVEFDNGEIIKADAEHLWRVGGSIWRNPEPREMTTRELLPWVEKAKRQRKSVYIATAHALELTEADLSEEPYALGVQLSVLDATDGIPAEYLRASHTQRLALLKGLMFAGGQGAPFSHEDKGLVEKVFELIASLGMKPSLSSKIINGVTHWEVRYKTGQTKRDRFFFKAIRPTTSVPVKCIRVENESHLFLAGRSMIPTHNTTCAAGFLLWKAMFEPDTTILIVANNFNGALEIMERVRYAYEMMPDFLRAGVVEYNKSSIKFDNGSRIVSRATSPDAARGLSISLLYVDEFAFLRSADLATKFWTAVRPTLATGGSCIVTSTPKSDADEFSTIWREACDRTDEYGNPTGREIGKNDFYPIKVTWDHHPERDAEWARKERGSLGDARFRQEYNCEFVSNDATLIDPIFLSQMKATEPSFLIDAGNYSIKWFKEPEPNRTYLTALDPALGSNGDYAAIQVFELPGMIQVAEWRSNTTAMKDQIFLLKEIQHFLDETLRTYANQRNTPQLFWTIENNSLGAAAITIVSHTGEENFPGEFVSEKRKKGQKRQLKGMVTTHASKRAALVRFKSLVETERMKIMSSPLIRELKTYITHGDTASAKPGTHDDLVSAALLCVRMLDYVTAWDDSFNELQEVVLDPELSYVEPAAFLF